MCQQIDWGHGCMLNASFPVRFYEIEDIATDMAGNVGTARKKVVVADGNMLFVKKKIGEDAVVRYIVSPFKISSEGHPELLLVRELEHQSSRYLIDTFQVMPSPD